MLTDEEKAELKGRLYFFARFFHGTTPPGVPKIGCLYAFEMSDDTVKIGVTTKPEKRVKGVEQAVYLDVLRVHQTGFAPYSFMTKLETRCHAKFAGRRVRGEYFDITFEEACAELDSHADEIVDALKAADEKLLDQINFYFNEFLPEYEAKQIKSFPKNIKPSKKNFTKNNFAALSEDTRICVLEMSDGTLQIVKLGQSKNIRSRVAEIKRDTGLTVNKIYFTPYMSRDNARLIEWACQETFSSRRVRGEFFSVKFEEACAVFDSFVKLVSVSAIISDIERGEKLLAIANMMTDSPEKQIVLKNSAKLIAGRKFD